MYRFVLKITLQNRKAFKKILDSLDVKQINIVPRGFNNNIFWSIGHIISVQQRLIYGLAGQPYIIDKEFVAKFLPGTKTEELFGEENIKTLKSLLLYTYDQMLVDINENKFTSFKPFATALRFEIHDLESAVTFNHYHEALHMGHILNLLKFL